MGKVAVDTNDPKEPDDPAGQMMYKALKVLAGLEIKATMSPRGELSDVKVPEQALKELQKLPGAEQLGDMFSPDGFKRMLSQGGLILPAGPVSKGDSWKNTVDLKMPFGKMTAVVDYTYQGPAEDGAPLEKIGLKTKATLEPDPKSPLKLTMKSQDCKGTAYFDNRAGRLREVVNDQTMDMESTVGDMTFKQHMVQKVVMRLTK